VREARTDKFILGIDISQGAVSKYMIRHLQPPSQTWRSFLRNHLGHLASVDFFVVSTATFRLLFVFIVLHHERRRIMHFSITGHPTSIWTSQQIREAFPWDTAPRYLIRNRDGSYGGVFRSRLDAMGILEVLTAPQSPWQNAYVERVIGSIRRECLEHVIVLNAGHLRRLLLSYLVYYRRSRSHMSLEKDCPDPRPGQSLDQGRIIAFREVGGLHHRYERLAV
jgi:transposase InsO family protein